MLGLVWPFGGDDRPSAPAAIEPPSAGVMPDFSGFSNPLTGTGCHSQCLPLASALVGAEDALSVELYSQAFGIQNVSGRLDNGAGESFAFFADYLPGQHSQTQIALPPALIRPGQAFTLCLSGIVEGTGQAIRWQSSFELSRPDPASGYQPLNRRSPVQVAFGDDASGC